MLVKQSLLFDVIITNSTAMINEENENSFEEEDDTMDPVNEDLVTDKMFQDERFEDDSDQQRQIEEAARAAEPAFTLDPDKGMPEGPENPDRLFDYDGEVDEDS